MRKTLFRLSLVLATVLVLFASCGKDEYDEDLLIGSWSATDNASYVFHQDHTGQRTKDGRTLPFTWSLDGDELELEIEGYEVGESSITVFSVYIIEELNETRMEAYDKEDSSKTIIVFTKK
jgi:hypothetical protein